MIQTIKKAWAIPELRKKIVFTALMLLIFRIGNAIPVPYVNTELLGEYLNQLSTTVLGLYNVMSGGAFANATVFALGVQPYINSSIIIQLLTIAIPALERMARDGGEEGKKKIQSITRYATVAIAILQGWGYYVLMKNYGILTGSGVWVALVIIVSFIAGSSFVMWMGEQITEFGIGNGISIILFAGILSRVPSMVGSMGSSLRSGTMTWWMAVLVVLGILALIVLITSVNGAERRVREASGRPQDVRRPGIHPSHEGEHVRRSAHHLRAVHRHDHPHGGGIPARSREGNLRLCAGQRSGQQERAVHDRLLPDDHRFQLLLCDHPVQPC